MAANRIYIQVDFNSGEAQSDIDQLNKKIDQIGQTSQKSTQQATKGISSFNVAIDQLGGAFGKLDSALAGLGIAKISQYLIDVTSQAVRARIALDALTGSAKEGAALFNDLHALARSGIFTMPDLLKAAEQLKAYGATTRETEFYLFGLQKQAQRTGDYMEALSKGVRGYGMILDKAKLTTREFYNLFQGSGLQALQRLQESLRRTEGRDFTNEEIFEGLQQGTIKSTRLLQELSRAMAELPDLGDKLRQNDPATQLKNLADEARDFGTALGGSLSPAIREFIGVLQDLLAIIGELHKQFEKMPGWAKYIAGAFPGTGIGPLRDLDYMAKGIHALRESMTGAANASPEFNAALKQAQDLQATLAGVKIPYVARKPFAGMTQEELNEQIHLMQRLYDQKVDLDKHANDRTLQANKELVKHQETIAQDALRRATENRYKEIQSLAEKAGDPAAATAAGLAEIRAKYADLFKEVAGNASATAKVFAAQWIEAGTLGLREVAKVGAAVEEQAKQQQKFQAEQYQKHLEFTQKVDEMDRETIRSYYEFQVEEAGAARDLQLAQLETVHRQTLAQEIKFLNESAAIREAKAQDVQKAQLENIAHEYQVELDLLDAQLNVGKIKHEEYTAYLEGLNLKYGLQSVEVITRTQHEIDRIRLEATRETNDAIIAEQKRVYERFKDSLGRVFDALLDKSTSVWQAIGNALKTTIISAIKEIVTSRAAAALVGLFGYGQVSFGGGPRGIGGQQPQFGGYTGGGGGGGFGGWLKALGLGGGGVAAAAAASAPEWLNAPAATMSAIGYAGRMIDETGGSDAGPYMATPSYMGVPITSQTEAQIMARYKSQLPWGAAGAPLSAVSHLKDWFGIGGSIQTGPGTAITWSAATPLQRLGSVLGSPGGAALAMLGGTALLGGGLRGTGVGAQAQTGLGAALTSFGLIRSIAPILGTAGAGLAAGGIGLAAAGLQRGGFSGLGMSIGGGALAGAAIGSVLPGIGTLIGAGIGAAVGAVAGTVRLFIKSLAQQARSRIREVYGVDISNQQILEQIAEIAKTKYGGSLSLAIYSQEVQDIVRLYALSSGQSQAGLARPEYPVTFTQSQAGGLALQPVYGGGQLVQSPYSGTTTTQLADLSYALRNSMFIQLNPQQANDLFEGRVVQAVQNNPTMVASANASAARSGDSRLAQASAFLEPATVMR
jgi:hypothetical protein